MAKRRPSPVTLGQVARQGVSDWFGKEIQTGYTTTYVWMANQFGHFGLGFLITFAIAWILLLIFGVRLDPAGWLLLLPIGHLAFWCYKEIRDYIIAVRTPGQINADAKERTTTFPVDKMGIASDAATAVLFIAFGIGVSYASILALKPWLDGLSFGFRWPLIAIAVMLVLAAYPFWYWLSQKMVFQMAGLPFQYRLESFPGHFEAPPEELDLIRDRVLAFVDTGGEWKHVLIAGPLKAGKTSLAVGMGTEHAFILGKARYTTWFKLLQLAFQPKQRPQEEGQRLWDWRSAEILIIDDVDPGVSSYSMAPQTVREKLQTMPKQSLEDLRGRRTVWVLGTAEQKDAWLEMLQETLGVGAGEIGFLELKRALGAWDAKKRTEKPLEEFPVTWDQDTYEASQSRKES